MSDKALSEGHSASPAQLSQAAQEFKAQIAAGIDERIGVLVVLLNRNGIGVATTINPQALGPALVMLADRAKHQELNALIVPPPAGFRFQ